MKRLFVLILVVLVLTGCSFNREKEVVSKLKQKYGEEFGVAELYHKRFGQSYYEALAYPKNDSELKFNVVINLYDENFSDEYSEKYICKKISDVIKANLDLTGEYYIFTEAGGPQPITDGLVESIKEYSDMNLLNKFYASIFVTEDTYELYEPSILFANIDYLDISADIYVVNKDQLQEVKEYWIENGSLDFKLLTEDFTFRTVE